MKLFKKLAIMAMAAFAFTACEDVPAPYNLPGQGSGNGNETTEGVYIDETFSTGFGIFSAVETQGEYPWTIDFNTAKATSYDSGTQTNNPAQSWLISSPIDLSNETEAYISFEYIIRYSESGKVAANHQLLISDDYVDDPATATWTSLDYGAVEGVDWSTFSKASVAIPAEFLNKSNITVALKYTATTTKAGTWEVKNFKLSHGTPTTEEKPEATEMTVAEAMAAFIDGQQIPAVVTGYIVGSVDGMTITEDANFSNVAVQKTNLLIADDAEEKDINKCMPVQLPSGKVRDALNLVDNAVNYKKQVKLTGSIEKYFGVAGLKSVSAYTIDGQTSEEPETPENAYINETFTTTLGSFTTQETVGNYPWIIDFSTAKATSYDSGTETNNAAESWLISPSVDFTNETQAYVKFEYVIRYAESGKVADNHQLLISSDYAGDPATATWTNIEYGATEAPDWQTFSEANVAVPTEFMGKNNVTFALKYTATTKAGTWEVKNFVVAHGTPTTEEPGNNTEVVVFDFTAPTTLTPAVTPAESGNGVEFEEVTFTSGDVSIYAQQNTATTKVRIWTKNDGTTEFRTYKNSIITITGKGMSKITFNGNKVSSMSADKGSFSEGVWTGNADSVTFNVTGTLNVTSIEVE